jgi:hypothetical protein
MCRVILLIGVLYLSPQLLPRHNVAEAKKIIGVVFLQNCPCDILGGNEASYVAARTEHAVNAF